MPNLNINLEDVAALRLPSGTIADISALSSKYGVDFAELLTIYCIENQFFPSKIYGLSQAEIEQKFILDYKDIRKKYKTRALKPYKDMFNLLLSEIKAFPVSEQEPSAELPYIYGDGWGTSRAASGCDITDRENIKGRLLINSMTDGTIESLLNTETGGYTASVRTDNGTVYTYAHLERYADGLAVNEKVFAGAFLGYMGNSGKLKDTALKQPVHLNVTIFVKFTKKKFYINPYPFLRYVENI
ncbi:hypothetical protein AGMMS49975_13290 [Clostridia bacterium]|nr:hypothetical protein AGMMS49975_13290 [Clostridia bacterium]